MMEAHDQPDAIVKVPRHWASGRRKSCRIFGADGPDDRRRHGELRDAGRLNIAEPGALDRIRWTPRDRADHPAKTAGGLSTLGILLEHGFLDAVVIEGHEGLRFQRTRPTDLLK